jgi:hypothetical protein
MTTRATIAVAVLLLACGDSRVAPWLGDWDVTLDEADRPCIDPMATPVTASTNPVWTFVDEGGGRLAIPGECRLLLEAQTAGLATFVRRSCDVMSPTGRRAMVEVREGQLRRDGDLIFGNLVVQITFADDGSCFEARTDVAAVRL